MGSTVNPARLHVRVGGRVQGVGFRWFVREEARRLGLSGWVTNLPDGAGEGAAGGEGASLQRLRAALAVGPSGALVSALEDLTEETGSALPYPFTIHR